MPPSLDTQTLQLRTQIARSRRRLDRHAQQLVSSTTQLISVERLANAGSSRSWQIALAVGVALSRWIFDTESLKQWRQKLLGQIVSRWLDRFVRRIRVAAWQYRRPTDSGTTEATNE